MLDKGFGYVLFWVWNFMIFEWKQSDKIKTSE